ncbi:DUF2179 domain-containing protein [Mycoplasmoides pirum]|uniref:DUF2179 domain-containing protein n=1 Tax=Mycoplasmoides pirum TaxID=2122 RepID=UPI000698A9E7|nr:DUF2179 domain-containing protein [Mycoplasmoides pirum]
MKNQEDIQETITTNNIENKKDSNIPNKNLINVNHGKNVKRAHLTSSLLHFASFYEFKKTWYRVLIIVICALAQGFLSILLIQNTGLYNFGISSITQGLARITFVTLSLQDNMTIDINFVYQLVFWVLYIVINIPLIIFSWFKIGRRFTYLTTIYLVITNVFGFALGQIPGIENLSLFTNVKDNAIHNLLISAYNNQNSISDPIWKENINKLVNDPNFIKSLNFIPGMWEVSGDASRAIALMCYGLLFSLTSALFYTVIFIVGGSSGGSDFISQWFAIKKYRSIGSMLVYVNLFTLTIGVLLGSYVPGSLILERFQNTGIQTGGFNDLNQPTYLNNLAWSAPLFFSPNIVATLLSVVIFSQIMDSWFPRYRLARVEIFTDKTMEIRELMLNDEHPHSLSIQDIIGGYSLDHKQAIVTISMYIDIPQLIKKIREIDERCLVSITSIRGIDGFIYLN